MSRLTDTQDMVARPGCCSTADSYIRVCAPDTFYGPDEKGWALTLYQTADPVRENVVFCPWCGTKLPGT